MAKFVSDVGCCIVCQDPAHGGVKNDIDLQGIPYKDAVKMAQRHANKFGCLVTLDVNYTVEPKRKKKKWPPICTDQIDSMPSVVIAGR